MVAARVLVLVLLVAASACRRPAPKPAPPDVAAPRVPGESQVFSATAYSIEGRTASGAQTRPGVVAADPRVLPLGSRIRVSDAGRYDGDYVVHDTGPAIRGREIDIYVPNDVEAKRFGRRSVKVQVLHRGDGR